MERISLKEKIKNGLLIIDGGMGTQLIVRGVEVGKCCDYLSIESPGLIFDIHKSYFDAGSDAVLTNTFGANKYALSRHGYADMVEKINTAGARIARSAAGPQKYVLGDIGPSGDFLMPIGTVKPGELKAAFAVQAKALAAGGVDGFIIETMMALDETIIAIEAVRSVSHLPLFVSFAFDKTPDGDFRTMMGLDLQNAVNKTIAFDIDAVGFNCGRMKLDDYIELAKNCVALVKKSGHNIAVLAEPNAGMPELVDGMAVYSLKPAKFADAALKIYQAGVSIIGGCCGSAPEHIKAAGGILRT